MQKYWKISLVKILEHHSWPSATCDKSNIFTRDDHNHTWYFPIFFASHILISHCVLCIAWNLVVASIKIKHSSHKMNYHTILLDKLTVHFDEIKTPSWHGFFTRIPCTYIVLFFLLPSNNEIQSMCVLLYLGKQKIFWGDDLLHFKSN